MQLQGREVALGGAGRCASDELMELCMLMHALRCTSETCALLTPGLVDGRCSTSTIAGHQGHIV